MKIETLLKDTATGPLQCIGPDATLTETAQKLFQCKVGALLVTTPRMELLGIVSECDLIPVIARNDHNAFVRPVSDIMTREVVSCTSTDEIGYVLRLMNTNGIRHIPIIDDGALVNMVSIRELTRAYELLQAEANTDPLTEVSNRRPFMRNAKTEFLRARRMDQPLAMAMFDLDHFKSINDTFGHAAGDSVLRAVSDILILEFRSVDLIGRLGGEEFAVIFPGTDLAGAAVACDRVRKVIARSPVSVENTDILVTTSVGVAAATPETADDASVLKRADRALYQAKSEGRNRVVAERAALDRSA